MQFHDDPTWMPPFGQPLCRSRHQVRGLQVRARLHVWGDLVLPTPRHGSPLREDRERRELHLLDRQRRDMCDSFSLPSACLGHKSLVETEYYLRLPNRCTLRPCCPICKEGRETEMSKKDFGGVFLGRPPPREEGVLAEDRDIVPRCAGPPHRFPRQWKPPRGCSRRHRRAVGQAFPRPPRIRQGQRRFDEEPETGRPELVLLPRAPGSPFSTPRSRKRWECRANTLLPR